MVSTRADDWSTTDGQSYHSVKVLSHDDAYVTILDSDGGARVLLRVLAPDLQHQFGYDAAKAAVCEAATVSADQKEHQDRAAEQAARDQQQAAAPSPASVPVKPVAGFTPITHGPPAPASVASTAKPSVDTLANNVKIDADQKGLDDIAIDIRSAKRDLRRDNETGNYHYDNSGTVHPNEFGESPEDRVARLEKKQKQLEEEITQLQAENGSVTAH